jgi:hypothetical protein
MEKRPVPPFPTRQMFILGMFYIFPQDKTTERHTKIGLLSLPAPLSACSVVLSLRAAAGDIACICGFPGTLVRSAIRIHSPFLNFVAPRLTILR